MIDLMTVYCVVGAILYAIMVYLVGAYLSVMRFSACDQMDNISMALTWPVYFAFLLGKYILKGLCGGFHRWYMNHLKIAKSKMVKEYIND